MHYPDRAPNQRFRIEQYVDFLRENGVTLEFSYLLEPNDDKIFYAPGNFFKKLSIVLRSWKKRKQDVRRATNFDAVLIIRESIFIGPAIFEKRLKKRGVKIIYDFDDAIWKLDVSKSNRWFGFLKFPAKTASIIRLADVVMAGNQYLADFASRYNKNVHIVPTTVDTDQFSPAENHTQGPVVIGWSGSLTTIKHFDLALPVLRKIREKYRQGVRFKVIGHHAFRNEELDITGIAWTKTSEVPELREIHIGIMPLPDDEWAKGKCGLKGLVYMSLGIPTVMSPVGVNSEIIRHGQNGFLPKTEEEWLEVLSQLIENPALRQSIGVAGRKTAVERYSVLSQREHYLKILGE